MQRPGSGGKSHHVTIKYGSKKCVKMRRSCDRPFFTKFFICQSDFN